MIKLIKEVTEAMYEVREYALRSRKAFELAEERGAALVLKGLKGLKGLKKNGL